MLIDDIRRRIKERLDHLEVGPKSNRAKERLRQQRVSESYLDQILNGRKGGGPIDPTVSKLEAIARALDVSPTWLLLGIGKPDMFFAPENAEPTAVAGVPASRSLKKAAAKGARKAG